MLLSRKSSNEVVPNIATMGEGLMGICRTENDFGHYKMCEQLTVCIKYIIIFNIYYTTTLILLMAFIPVIL